MTKLPPLKARVVISGLQALGFEKVRQKGGHAIFHHRDCRRAPIPIHPAKTISRYLLSDILKQLEIDEDEFLLTIGRR
ncbi:MAG: type II toxin-antitoxin system HicA family toxin [Dehalococcoidia bacterium]|nr:type II toxin-antitoxin system HicA family toxin [Dehalococcoidia bacterium]